MNKILFIDTLTTGLNPDRCEIYRIGGVFCREEFMKMEETVRFDICARPSDNARISETSLWTGGVTRKDLIGYPSQDEAFAYFMEILDNQVDADNPSDKIYLAGYNVTGMDMPFVRAWFASRGNNRWRDYFHMQSIDVMILAAFVLMDERNIMDDFLMQTVARQLGIEPQGSRYNCTDNAMTALKIYMTIKERLLPAQDRVYSESGRIMNNYIR